MSEIPGQAAHATKPAATPVTNIVAALKGTRGIFAGVLAISSIVNLLALTGALYMLQIYDRVLTSHSIPTLMALTLLVVGLYLFQGILEVLRTQVLIRLGAQLDERLSRIAHIAVMHLPLAGASQASATQPVRDVETIRAFFERQGPVAICDIPWLPFYLGFVFLLHPWLGWLAVVGLCVLLGLTLITERPTQHLQRKAREADGTRRDLATAHAHNAEVLQAMGLQTRAANHFSQANTTHLILQTRANDITGTVTGITKVFRMMLQSALLGLGAYLTLQGEISAGAIIAASVAATRAFAPIEMAISNWKIFVAARQSYHNLKKVIAKLPTQKTPLDLPPPTEKISIEDISVAAPGKQTLILKNISFELKAGQALGIIGPSASGKSTLARALTGVWPLARGSVRFDGASRESWANEKLGQHIGYLPQNIELFDGSIADNIARFEPEPESAKIVTAAKTAGIHEMILRLNDGYETQLGANGMALSAGQRQRIALARALYGNPFFIILDEPNANLDNAGDIALHNAIQMAKQQGSIAIVIAHRPSALAAVDTIAVIDDGKLVEFGPKEEVLKKVLRNTVTAQAS